VSRAATRSVCDLRFGIPGHFTYILCESCASWLLHPQPAQTELNQLYEKYYNFPDDVRQGGYESLREAFFSPRLAPIWAVPTGDVSFLRRRGRGRLLDYGCNEGRNLTIYAAQGWQAEGYEINPVAARAARAGGFPVYEGDPQRLPAARFDVVVLSNVLEHALDPRSALRAVRRALRPGGELWITTPNAGSWYRSVAGAAWVNWHPPFHILLFSPPALCSLLEHERFEVECLETFSPPLWQGQSLLARIFSSHGRPTRQLRSPLLVAATTAAALAFSPLTRWLDERQRGDCIRVRAKASLAAE
jgi:SAM-dependent methyltransferase